jgi:hypothetical protein
MDGCKSCLLQKFFDIERDQRLIFQKQNLIAAIRHGVSPS